MQELVAETRIQGKGSFDRLLFTKILVDRWAPAYEFACTLFVLLNLTTGGVHKFEDFPRFW